jgi:putative glutamine amidotransferase
MIPLATNTVILRSIFDRLDAIVISGGGDIDPQRYGAERSVYTAGVDTERDEVEIQLAQWAVAEDKPLLAICRGHQILNVALGGTLNQDIQDTLPGSLRHDAPSDDWFARTVHDVSVTPGSKLHMALGGGATELAVNSLHHQGLDRVADALTVVACAVDGIVEGVEIPDRRFVVGVQWHPEALVDEHPRMKQLFENLVSVAAE